MTDKNGSNDIAEMLRLLRQSVDNDRANMPVEDEETSEKETEEEVVLEEFEEEDEELEVIEEDDDSDPWYEDDIELSEDEEETDEEEELEIEIAAADEREDEDDEDDPWFSGSEKEPENLEAEEESEEIEDFEEAIEETIEETIEESEEINDDEGASFAFGEEEPEEELPDILLEEEDDETQASDEDEIDVFAYPEEEEETDEDEIDVFAYPDEDPYEGIIADEPIFEEEIEEVEETEEEEIIEEEEIEEESLERELDEIKEIESNVTDEMLDDTDISLLQNMGYTSFAAEDAEEEDEPEEKAEALGDIAYDHNGEEHVIKKQSDEIKIDYTEQKRKTLLRLIIAGGAALLLFIYEYLTFAGVELPWIFNQHEFPVSHSMISLQLLLISVAMSLNLVAKGIYDTFKLRSTPYSVGSVLIFVNVVYTVMVAVFRPEKYMLFNFVGALSAVLAIVYEYIILISEEKAFHSVSFDEDTKYVFSDDSEAKPFGDQPTLRAYRTGFNKNFFAKIGKRVSDYNYLGILIPAVIVFGVLLFGLVWLIRGDAYSAINAGMLVINFALPVGVLGTYSIPLFFAISSLKKEKGAIIGHSSVECYSNTRFVTFDEADIFPSIKTTYIDLKPCGDSPIAEVLAKTSRLFSAIGGPLRHMVETTGTVENEGKVELVGIFDDGISAMMNSETMLVGSARFLEINNVSVNASSDYRDSDGSNEILYVAIGGKLAARYYIKYIPDPDFVEAINMLGANGISVGIRTRNPGVNSRIIEKRCPEMKYKVYTIKSLADGEKDITSYQSSADSGIVAHGKASKLARPLIMALGLKKYYKIDTYLRYASAAIGALLVSIYAIMGRIGELSSLSVALYQLGWILPAFAAAWLISLKKKKQ